ncbi:MAG: peptidylprolyl isomerase [Chitinophagaceae bacterium]|nr:peptidylprolyl isomerase [Chitinophagaceae bacterium]
MKYSLLALMLTIASVVVAQPTVREQFEKIKTEQEAQKFIEANPTLKPILFNLTYGKDTSLIDKRLLKQNQGDIFSVGYVTYKVLKSSESINYRASYIFLDGSSLSASEIENLKKIILDKHSAGTSWEALSDEYTMDGNKTRGDTDWFFGIEMMPKEFQDAVAKHKKGDIFFVDVPENQWHYIIKKTYDDAVKKEITVLRANGR